MDNQSSNVILGYEESWNNFNFVVHTGPKINKKFEYLNLIDLKINSKTQPQRLGQSK